MTGDSLIRHVGRYLALHRRYSAMLAAAAALMLVDAALALGLMYLPRFVFDTIVPARDLRAFWIAVGVIAVAIAVREGVIFKHRTLLIATHNQVSLGLMLRMIARVYATPTSFLDRTPSGYLRARIMADVKSLEPVGAAALMKDVVELLFMTGAMIVLLKLQATLVLALLAVLVAHTLTVGLPHRHLAASSGRNSEKWAQASMHVQDRLQGLRTTILFNRQRAETRRMGALLADATSFTIGFLTRVEGLTRIISVTGALGLFGVLALSIAQFMDGRMTAGEVASFFAYSTYFLNSAATVYVSLIQIGATRGPLARVFQILDARPAARVAHGDVAPALRGGIEFDDVSFEYPDAPAVLKGLTLRIAPGERVGIVGRSGAGKTTMLNMLLGLYETSGGTLRLDGIDTRAVSKRALRRQMGYVSQDVFFFTGTIRDNIAYARESATDDEVAAAARAAGLEFIEDLPQGYATPMGELGARLSGGQRQRVAIARVLLLDPAVILLDEATSHQDRITEDTILTTLNRVAEGKTLLVVTHSAAALRLVDRIAVLDDGRVAAEGTHDELLTRSALYRELCAPRIPVECAA